MPQPPPPLPEGQKTHFIRPIRNDEPYAQSNMQPAQQYAGTADRYAQQDQYAGQTYSNNPTASYEQRAAELERTVARLERLVATMTPPGDAQRSMQNDEFTRVDQTSASYQPMVAVEEPRRLFPNETPPGGYSQASSQYIQPAQPPARPQARFRGVNPIQEASPGGAVYNPMSR